jgi:glycosyltransferase involved in cell wall biosynthesis
VRTVHVVLPDGVDDPLRPSGGNAYDRRVCDGLVALGRSVAEHVVPGRWPDPDVADRRALRAAVAAIPDGATVLVDGLIASTVPEVLVPESRRVRVVALVHLPLGEGLPDPAVRDEERAVLSAAAAVLTTSPWTRHRLLDRYALPPCSVHVAEPGVEAAPASTGSSSGSRLLCVAAVTPHKGHDVLVDALGTLPDLEWHLTLVGSLARDPAYVDHLVRHLHAAGLAHRVDLTGPLVGDALAGAYAAADVLALTSRGETFGMVVTEALARGLPVVAAAVGGVPHALGRAPDGTRPGLLVPPDDPAATAAALRTWLGDPVLRDRLRRAAAARRTTLTGWDRTAREVAAVLDGVAA